VALKLIYQMFAKLLSWIVLHARSDPAMNHRGNRRCRARRPQSQRPMRPPGVVMGGVYGKYLAQVLLAEDQHPIGDLGADGQNEVFGDAALETGADADRPVREEGGGGSVTQSFVVVQSACGDRCDEELGELVLRGPRSTTCCWPRWSRPARIGLRRAPLRHPPR
jgi:hypothetical protein